MKAVVRDEKFVHATADHGVSTDIMDKVLSPPISALGDIPLRAVQSCSSFKNAWDKLQTRYAGKTLINKLGVFNGLLNFKFMRGR